MKILNKPLYNSSAYVDREVVRAVITQADNVLLFNGLLVGGGVENGETNEAALEREVMEEAGVVFDQPRTLQTIILYRDELMKRYVTHGYHVEFVSQGQPTTVQLDEMGATLRWVDINSAIEDLKLSESEIVHGGSTSLPGDRYQARLLHTRTTLILLEQVRASARLIQ